MVVNISFVTALVTVVVMAVIGMGVADALQIMKIKVIDYTFRKVIEHFMCSQKCS